ncbi:MAG: DnaJ domain-containing protein [Alphaproteobacteria bacterium]|nr:DnaJ domain-containing protein [Alphaproteobacteria bacterium]
MKKRAFYYWKETEENQSQKCSCQFQGCKNEGIYKAPKSDLSSDPKCPDSWLWFCIDHVRDYNASWNYFKDMSEEEIWKEHRRDITWQRPTWPLGSWYTRKNRAFEYAFSSGQKTNHAFDDPFGVFNDWRETTIPSKEYHSKTPESEAMTLFELSHPFDNNQLQIAYRKLVKKFHPDLNQGCLQSEEKLKNINHAYTLLKKILSP